MDKIYLIELLIALRGVGAFGKVDRQEELINDFFRFLNSQRKITYVPKYPAFLKREAALPNSPKPL
jgi:hypothetical protein